MYQKLSGRPFMVIYQVIRPAQGVRTERAGWATEPQYSTTYERLSIVDRVNNKHLTEGAIIIDIEKRSVVKSRNDRSDDAAIVDQYMTKYASQIAEGVSEFQKRQARLGR